MYYKNKYPNNVNMGADQSVILKGSEGDLYAHRINMFFGECKLKGEDGEAAL